MAGCKGILQTTLVVVVLQIIAAGYSHGASDSEELTTLRHLCSNKDVSLDRVSQVKSLINAQKSNKVDECINFGESFDDIGKIIDSLDSGKVCHPDVVKQIRDYHMKFISTADKKQKSPGSQVPASLKSFFIHVALQVDALCKLFLINDLERDTHGKIVEEDFAIIRQLELSSGNILGSQNSQPGGFDDIVLLGDLSNISEGSEENKLLLKVKTTQFLRDVVRVCKTKFAPFYEKLILPIVGLSNLGYSYEGELLERELVEFRNSELVKRWYRIVEFCEAFKGMKFYEDSEELASGRKAFTFITGSEANDLKEVGEDLNEEDIIKYEPDTTEFGDHLWIRGQEELNRVVKNLDAHDNEMKRTRQRLMKRLYKHVREALVSGKALLFVSDMVKNVKDQVNSKRVNVNEEMVLMIDEAISDGKLDKNDEKAVAGFGSGSGTSTAGRVLSSYPRRVMAPMGAKDETKWITWLSTPFKLDRISTFFGLLFMIGCLLLLIAALSTG